MLSGCVQPDDGTATGDYEVDGGISIQAGALTPSTLVERNGRFAQWSCESGTCVPALAEFEIFQGPAKPAIPGEKEPNLRSTEYASEEHRLWVSSLTSDDVARVVIELDQPPGENRAFGASLKGLTRAQRENAASQQRARFKSSQASLKAFIERSGGIVHGSFWSSNAMDAEIPGDLIATIEARDEVVGVWRADPTGENAYDMSEVRDQILAGPYYDAGLVGERSASTSSDNISICLVEWASDGLNRYHAAFLESAGGASRVQAEYICDGVSCIPAINSVGNWEHHTGTASLAAGSILDGQDPKYPGTETADQFDRSGMATKALIYGAYAEDGTSTSSYRAAFEKCVEFGADVIINASGLGGYDCAITSDSAIALRPGVNMALNADIPVVSATGNTNVNTCSAMVPAAFPEVVGVGALITSGASYSSYGGEPVGSGNPGAKKRDDSAEGHVPTTGYGGSSVLVPAVTVTSATGPSYFAATGTGAGSLYGGPFGKTSGATAIVGGSAALIVERLKNAGLSPTYLEVNAMIGLFGDGAISTTAKARTYVDDEYGFGRFKMQLPWGTTSDPGTIEASKWGVGTVELDGGQYAHLYLGDCMWTTSCTIGQTGIKAAAFIEDPGKNSYWLPNVDLEIVDVCNGYSVIKSADAFNFGWKRIRVFDTWRFQGTCPALRVTLDDSSYYQNVRIGVAMYMFDSAWEWN